MSKTALRSKKFVGLLVFSALLAGLAALKAPGEAYTAAGLAFGAYMGAQGFQDHAIASKG
jgi:hypothetical protein